MDEETILVVTGESDTRGNRRTQLKISELSETVNSFLDQISRVLSNAPDQIGEFRFEEVEIHAEITAKGSLAILGTGGEAGATGGIKFVFRRK